MFKSQFIFLVLFTFIFSIFVSCVGEPRGVGIHGAIWGAILSGSGKKQQSMFEFGRKITKTTNFTLSGPSAKMDQIWRKSPQTLHFFLFYDLENHHLELLNHIHYSSPHLNLRFYH